MNRFKLRAECSTDTTTLAELLPAGSALFPFTEKVSVIGDDTVFVPSQIAVVETPLSLEELQHYIALVEDGHVMHETVLPEWDYTGERTFEEPSPEIEAGAERLRKKLFGDAPAPQFRPPQDGNGSNQGGSLNQPRF